MSAKKGGKKGGQVAGKDAFQRMNFLYQMATLTSNQTNPVLSSYYGRMAKLVGQKMVLRMEPEIKRKICKSCKHVLIPGTSARLQITGKDRVCEIRCDHCDAKKVFHVNDKYKMWLDDPESVVETISIGDTSSNSTMSSSGNGNASHDAPATKTTSAEQPLETSEPVSACGSVE